VMGRLHIDQMRESVIHKNPRFKSFAIVDQVRVI